MDHFLKGWKQMNGTKEELRERMEILERYIGNETRQSVLDSIIALVGPPYGDEHHRFHRWPAAVSDLLYKESMNQTERQLWSAFCFHNGIPFGMMVAFVHARGMLQSESAYINLFATWSELMEDEMRSMASMAVVDRKEC